MKKGGNQDLDGISKLREVLRNSMVDVGIATAGRGPSLYRFGTIINEWLDERVSELVEAESEWILFNRKIWKRQYEKQYARKRRARKDK